MNTLNTDVENSFRNLVNSIESVFNTKLTDFDNFPSDLIQSNTMLFYNQLEDERLYLLFLHNKIKVFSSKEDSSHTLSKSLFGESMLLKNIFNNQTEMNKLILWDSLLNLYYTLETHNNNRKDRLDDLSEKFNQIKVKLSDHVKEQILPDDVNNSTSNMVNDIIGSFQNLISENKNPFENIMDITSKISEKYYKDIEGGNIEVDKLLKNMPFPGKEGGMNMEDMMNGDMMKNVGDMMGNMMGGDMGDMMKGMMGGKEEKKEPTVIDENFSTANVEVGEDETEKKGKGMVGNMMNMAKNLPSMEGMPDLGELTGMMKDITSGNMDMDNLQEMKGKMDSFMSNTLGVDMNEFNKNMENLVSKMGDNEGNEDNTNTNSNTNTPETSQNNGVDALD
jgi:hypothetical protein